MAVQGPLYDGRWSFSFVLQHSLLDIRYSIVREFLQSTLSTVLVQVLVEELETSRDSKDKGYTLLTGSVVRSAAAKCAWTSRLKPVLQLMGAQIILFYLVHPVSIPSGSSGLPPRPRDTSTSRPIVQ
jgi:hypothetical protein